MKKLFFLSAALILSAGMIWMTGCKKDDSTPPTITLKGSDPMSVTLGTSPSDPGATANDDKDGDISSSITSDWSTKVTPGMKGTYTVTYSVSDAAGNTGTATRTVKVVNDAEFLAGTYLNAKDSCQVTAPYTFNATITTSNTVNDKFTINNFGAFGTSVNIDGSLTSSTNISFSPQAIGTAGNLLSGSGTVTQASSPTKFNLQWTWNDGTTTETCWSNYTKP